MSQLKSDTVVLTTGSYEIIRDGEVIQKGEIKQNGTDNEHGQSGDS